MAYRTMIGYIFGVIFTCALIVFSYCNIIGLSRAKTLFDFPYDRLNKKEKKYYLGSLIIFLLSMIALSIIDNLIK